ncbi:hypothetical protein TARUN_8744 [Trichoderma arundinaceum]|uniref:Uncharacterized protein n=1 Tax=Trichoderma arundinaceum TaxID=490622 RepID=A0A395NBL7_TRIAR|nr:hypothetical protein TARUN_8744 [Trichoderma arundinaceum]
MRVAPEIFGSFTDGHQLLDICRPAGDRMMVRFGRLAKSLPARKHLLDEHQPLRSLRLQAPPIVNISLTFGLVDMELTEKRSVISRELKALEPGSLYITISVPRELCSPYSVFHYLPYLPNDLDLASYEVSCAEGLDREEFDWGVYWHRGHGDGTWYGLRRVSSTIDASMGNGLVASITSMGAQSDGANVACPLPFYVLSRQEMLQSPRLHTRVAGLIRVLRVPDPFAARLTSYLDWLAVQTASSATRSFIWASSVYLRTRRHFSADPYGKVSDVVAANFDTTGFLQEALHLAYKEVWYGLAGQLPRPIMASAFGVELLLMETTGSMTAEERSEDEDADSESTQPHRWGYVYQQHAEAGSPDTPLTEYGISIDSSALNSPSLGSPP